MPRSEALTRAELIDKNLALSGWNVKDPTQVHNTKREAYDHYLPNLAPACHECNCTYKLAKDPVNTATGRRKAFYPYANPENSIEVTIDLTSLDIEEGVKVAVAALRRSLKLAGMSSCGEGSDEKNIK